MKLELIKNMGLRWTIYRTQYEIKKKFGYLERAYKPIELNEIDLGQKVSKSLVKKNIR